MKIAAGVITVSLMAAPAMAGIAKLNVSFGYFPEGTTCQAFGTTGKVKVKVKREIKYSIRGGDSSKLAFKCVQPDGRGFSVNVGPMLPDGDLKMVAMQINQDGNAHIFWDNGGLTKTMVPNAVNWDK